MGIYREEEQEELRGTEMHYLWGKDEGVICLGWGKDSITNNTQNNIKWGNSWGCWHGATTLVICETPQAQQCGTGPKCLGTNRLPGTGGLADLPGHCFIVPPSSCPRPKPTRATTFCGSLVWADSSGERSKGNWVPWCTFQCMTSLKCWAPEDSTMGFGHAGWEGQDPAVSLSSATWHPGVAG